MGLLFGAVFFAIAFFFFWMIAMPGNSYSGELSPLTDEEKDTAERLEHHVYELAQEIGERNFLNLQNLQEAAGYLETTLTGFGYEVRSQEFSIAQGEIRNLEVEVKGRVRPEEIVVVGAHYDSVLGCPGADDNATGVAAVIELARIFFGITPENTLRFVFFVNEEPPFFQTPIMGSFVYASELHIRGENIIAMFSLETIGYYSSEAKSQNYPFPFSLFYPDRGDFIGFVGNLGSRSLVRQSLRIFRDNCQFPSEGVAALSTIPGIGWSDHWSFWQFGFPAIMITDTAPFRNPNYHRESDLVNSLDFASMARVVQGLEEVISTVAESN